MAIIRYWLEPTARLEPLEFLGRCKRTHDLVLSLGYTSEGHDEYHLLDCTSIWHYINAYAHGAGRVITLHNLYQQTAEREMEVKFLCLAATEEAHRDLCVQGLGSIGLRRTLIRPSPESLLAQASGWQDLISPQTNLRAAFGSMYPSVNLMSTHGTARG